MSVNDDTRVNRYMCITCIEGKGAYLLALVVAVANVWTMTESLDMTEVWDNGFTTCITRGTQGHHTHTNR